MTDHPRITVQDEIRPLVLLRYVAQEVGVTLSDEEEQAICRDATSALTAMMIDELRERVRT